jgi:hypothetical protein
MKSKLKYKNNEDFWIGFTYVGRNLLIMLENELIASEKHQLIIIPKIFIIYGP